MDIDLLERKKNLITDYRLRSILELIIEAVRDYPTYGLNDTDLYFIEVKKVINQDLITLESLRNYVDLNSDKEDNSNLWISTSLGSLLESFELMDLYKISFKDIKSRVLVPR